MILGSFPVSDIPAQKPVDHRRIARISVDLSIIRQLLCLPDSAELIDVRPSDRIGNVDLVVLSPDFKPVKTGDRIPSKQMEVDVKGFVRWID